MITEHRSGLKKAIRIKRMKDKQLKRSGQKKGKKCGKHIRERREENIKKYEKGIEVSVRKGGS